MALSSYGTEWLSEEEINDRKAAPPAQKKGEGDVFEEKRRQEATAPTPPTATAKIAPPTAPAAIGEWKPPQEIATKVEKEEAKKAQVAARQNEEPGWADPKHAEWAKSHQPQAAASAPPHGAAVPAKQEYSSAEMLKLQAAARNPNRRELVKEAQLILHEHGLKTGNKNGQKIESGEFIDKNGSVKLDGIAGEQTISSLKAAGAVDSNYSAAKNDTGTKKRVRVDGLAFRGV